MSKHSQPDDCLRFLKEANSPTEGANTIARFGAILERGCLDHHLNFFTRRIGIEDIDRTCIFLRSYGIFDQEDHERILNDSLFPTPERKATELLTKIGKRGPHAYWFLAHSLKTRRKDLFKYFHGENFHCCVCKDIEKREKEEQLEFPDLDSDKPAIVVLISMMIHAIKEMVEDKCTTAREAVNKRLEKNKKHDKKQYDTEDPAVTPDPVVGDMEPDHVENTNNEDLEGQVTALATALSKMKEFKGKFGKKCTTAKEAINRRRKRFSAPGQDSLDDDDDVEGSTLATPTDETNKPRQLKDEKSLSPDNLVPKEQFCNAIRRKRAYKAAFVTLSAVTLFTFYPLPAFDFLFLFVYCNFLMFLITF